MNIQNRIAKKFVYLLQKVVFSFLNMSCSKKVNYLLRKYDLFIQKYDLFKENCFEHMKNVSTI